MVPSAPGGDRALYPTVFAPFFSTYSRQSEGRAGVHAGRGRIDRRNNVYSVAAPDGLTLVTPLVAVVTAQAVGEATVKYDVRSSLDRKDYRRDPRAHMSAKAGQDASGIARAGK